MQFCTVGCLLHVVSRGCSDVPWQRSSWPLRIHHLPRMNARALSFWKERIFQSSGTGAPGASGGLALTFITMSAKTDWGDETTSNGGVADVGARCETG
jgi:hypothetical protein